MNWVDLVVLLVLAAFAYHGWVRGFVLTLLDVIGLLLAFIVALLLYPYPGGLLQRWGLERALANSLSFIGIFVIIESIFWVFGRRLYYALPRETEVSPANHALGIIPGIIKGILFVALAILILLNTPLGISSDTIRGSFFGRTIMRAGASIHRTTAALIPRDFSKDFEFITIEPGSNEMVKIPSDPNARLTPAAEDEMLKLLNNDRAQNGLKPLVMDQKLQQVARAHSQDMFARGYFAHVSPDGVDPFQRMSAAKIGFAKAGENLALAPSTQSAESGLMKSPGHRRNILDPQFHKVGIGVYSAGPFRMMFTQDFTN